MALAMDSLGVPAISLNAFQVAMHTSTVYGNARLKRIDTERIKNELANRKIVVITGFQGESIASAINATDVCSPVVKSISSSRLDLLAFRALINMMIIQRLAEEALIQQP